MKKLSEIGQIVGGGTPSTKIKEYWNGEIPWITPKDLSNYNNRYIDRGERNITKEGYENSSAILMPANTILFTSRAPIGYTAISKNEVCTNQGFKSFICDKCQCDYLYMYYWFLSNVENIKNKANGSTFQEVSGNVMKNIEIELPNLKEQIKIGRILDRIDSKIELNNKIIDNLQKLSQELFKRWFVDFEFPNEDGKPYKSSGGKMIESELGMIPEGWRVDKLKNTVLKAGTGADAIQRAPIVDYDTGIRCVRVGDMTNNRDVLDWGFAKMTERDFLNYQLKKDDIVITRTAVNGLSYFIEEDLKAVCNNGLIRLKVNKKYNAYFTFCNMQTESFMIYINMINAETSTRPNMKLDYLLNYKFINPELDIQNKFVEIVNSIKNKKNLLLKQNKTLSDLRDTLLPKLMNGEINLDKIEI